MGIGAEEDEEGQGWRRDRAATTVHGVVVVGGGMVAAGAATGVAAKVTEAAVRCDSARGATEVAVVDGAWAECSGPSGAGGTAAAVAAPGAAVKAATGATVKVTAAAVCGGSVRGATKVPVVSGARAESCCHRGAGGAMETAGGDEVRGDFVDGDPKVSPLMLATGSRARWCSSSARASSRKRASSRP